MNCLFCDFVNNKKDFYKVWEDVGTLAFLDINPVNKGHVLLIPKKHYSDIFDMDDDLYQKLFSNAKKLSLKLKGVINCPRVGIAVEGFGVDHVHIHLVPVYKGGELNPDRAYKASKSELKEVQEKLFESFDSI
jgi:histidine triad (HIT) family protein